MAQIDEACKETCAKNGLADGYVRPIAWRGPEKIGVSAQETKSMWPSPCWEWPSYFTPEEKAKGIRLTWAKYSARSPEPRRRRQGRRPLHDLHPVQARRGEGGYADALMLDYRGYVAEATGANVFFLQDGVMHTPTPDCSSTASPAADGDRAGQGAGFEVVERHIRPEELSSFWSASSPARPPRSPRCRRSASTATLPGTSAWPTTIPRWSGASW